MCVTVRGSCAVQLISFHPSDALSQSHVHDDQHHGVLLCQCKCVKSSMMEGIGSNVHAMMISKANFPAPWR